MSLIRIRASQGRRTLSIAEAAASLPERYRGRPAIDPALCRDGCRDCADVCPTEAIGLDESPRIDLGRCVFCQDCVVACPEGAVTYTRDHRLASTTREGLVIRHGPAGAEGPELAASLGRKMLELFGRSLKLRHVSAGDCSACGAELQALGNVVFDLSRFGIQFVASPRHADGLVITGPVTRNMRLALEKTYEALPTPRLVIAVGACAISGGPFRDLPSSGNGADGIVPVDLYLPGCPPHPLTMLDGLLRLLGRLENEGR